jgi:hypothetical protein
MEDDSPIAGLTASVDIYCERIDPGFWAEPVNALTNLAFLLAAAFVWPRVRDRAMGRARHPFPVAHPQRDHAGLDDRNLSPRPAEPATPLAATPPRG